MEQGGMQKVWVTYCSSGGPERNLTDHTGNLKYWHTWNLRSLRILAPRVQSDTTNTTKPVCCGATQNTLRFVWDPRVVNINRLLHSKIKFSLSSNWDLWKLLGLAPDILFTLLVSHNFQCLLFHPPVVPPFTENQAPVSASWLCGKHSCMIVFGAPSCSFSPPTYLCYNDSIKVESVSA